MSLAADLASILEHEPGAAAGALAARLAQEEHVPPIAELVELGERARRERASKNELLLAIGCLLSLHAAQVPAVRH